MKRSSSSLKYGRERSAYRFGDARPTINETKYKAMIDAGLCFTELGIQTGSVETMRLYKRGMTNEQLLKA